jgi:hypothetical protein
MKILLVNTNRMKPAIVPIGLDYLADSIIAGARGAYWDILRRMRRESPSPRHSERSEESPPGFFAGSE